ncbi:hypothetical protein CIP107576_01020 [Corynebacterium diphtheriae]|nr:hypothetical protein CIP107576_01020 [Corynebacterium diphtheriae]
MVSDFVAKRLEVWVWLTACCDTEVVLELVCYCINPRLVATVRVVGNGELSGELGDLVSLSPQFLCLCGIKLDYLRALQTFLVAVNDWRGEVLSWGAGILEDRLGDFFTVNCVRDCCATQCTFFTREVFQLFWDGKGLEDSSWLVNRTIA